MSSSVWTFATWVLSCSPAILLMGCSRAWTFQLWNSWLHSPSVLFSASIQMFAFLSLFSCPSPISDSYIFLLTVCPWLLLPHLPLQSDIVIFWFLDINVCCMVYLLYALKNYFFPPAIYLISIHHFEKCFSFTFPVGFPLRVFTSGNGQIMLSHYKILIMGY